MNNPGIGMKSFDEAFKIVMNSVVETGTETISFIASSGRILAEEIRSDSDMPPFNRSAVDGYACRRSDLKYDLEVLEVISAGKEPHKIVREKQCSKIMTGAIVPDGGEVVFMVEDSEILPSGKVRFTGSDLKLNISFKGEDVRKGDVVLKPGKLLRPQDISVIAAVGHTDVVVKKKPVVGIISTGDELVEPYSNPGIAQIRNSNAYQLLSQVKGAGGIGQYYGISPDVESITFEMINKALFETDILLITGGVSMGDFDFVPSILEKSGVNILFDKINVQPGRPLTFGVHSKGVVFGLPGNPVSSFVQFELMVRPFINKMMGCNLETIDYKLPMAVRYERKSSERLGWIPVFINENREVVPVSYHGSAHITALSYSDGIIPINPGIKTLEKGEYVSVRSI
jgi:molybdopterin molybdotransferase